MPTRRLEVEIVGDTKSLDRAYARTTRSSKKLGLSLGSIGKAGIAGAAVGGAALLTKGLTSSINAAKEAEKAQVRLDQAFKATGASRAQYAASQAKINAVSKKAALDDEDLSDSLASITRSTGSVKKGMQGMELAANIARGRNVSLAVATKAVEKAMLGSDTALKRLGISVPKVSVRYDALKEKVKVLQDRMKGTKGPARDMLQSQIDAIKAGYDRAKQLDKEESAQSALTKAQRKFAGSAEAYGKTAAGAQEQLSVAFENLQEKVGAKLLPVLTKLTLKLVELIDWSEKNWPKFSAAAQQVYAKVQPIIQNLLARFRDISKVFLGVVKIIQGIKNGEWGQVWQGIKMVVVNQLKLIYHSFLELPKKILAGLGRKAFAGLKRIGVWIKDAIVSGITGLAQGIINKIKGALSKAKGIFGKLIPDIPDIPGVGGGDKKPDPRSRPGAGLRRASPSGNPGDAADRRTAAARPIVVQTTVVVDGKTMNKALGPHRRADARRNPPQRRGPNAGVVVA